jgi:FKBP-type peptidyl-prolyl cis-trans isomerase
MQTLSSKEWIAVVVVLVVVIGFMVAGPLFSKGNPLSPDTAGDASRVMGSDTASSDLQATDVAVGTGALAEAGKTVAVHYVGTLLDGTKFDSSLDRGQPIEFTLGAGQVIPGWEMGIAGMKVGGKRHLVIPGSLAYGENGVKDPNTGTVVIPPNASLVFDVELMAVK